MSDAVVIHGSTESAIDYYVEVKGKELVVVVDVESITGSLTVTIEGVTSSGYRYPLLVSDAITAISTTPLRIFPGATPSENAVANDLPPSTVILTAEVSGDIDYGIDAFSRS